MKILTKTAAVGWAFTLFALGAQFQEIPGGIKAEVDPYLIELKFYTPSTVRVTKRLQTHSFTNQSLSVIANPQQIQYKIGSGNGLVTLESANLKVMLELTTGRISFAGPDGIVLLVEKERGFGFTNFNDAGVPSLSAWQSFILGKEEAIFGLGQQQHGKLVQRGVKLRMIQGNTDDYVPIFVSEKGYGVIWDNSSPTLFTDTQEETTFRSEVCESIDYYFVFGKNVDGVIAGIRELTGRAPMLPVWAFGYWQCKERYKSRSEIVGVVRRYRELGVPLDGVILDWRYWGNNYLWNAMEFLDPEFPDPAGMIREIHGMNCKIMISIWNSFGPMTKQYRELKEIGALLDFITWPESGCDLWPPRLDYPSGVRVYDAYNPTARDIYWKYLKNGLLTLGIDGWWIDSSEPDHLQFKDSDLDVRTYLGSFRRVRNAYPLMTVGGVYTHQRQESSDRRVLILTRSAFTGQQRYGSIVWSGDVVASWQSLRNQIPAALNFSLCGIPYWNSDIGGFFLWNFPRKLEDPEYRELYVRWLQFGTFCGMMRSHGTDAPREIYQFGTKGDPEFNAIERFINLRYLLLPYIYSAAWEVTANHSTLMRALVMDFAGDPRAVRLADQFMFGKSILVCPVTERMYATKEKLDLTRIKTKKVYLPKGTKWYDFWTGEEFTGGQELERECPLEMIPLFVRAGSVLPIGPKVQYSTQKKWDELEIRVYGGANGQFVLYEDELDSYNYDKGIYTTITFDWDDSSGTLTIGDRQGAFPGMLEERIFKVVLVSSGKGIADVPTQVCDKEIKYTGKKTTVKLR